MNQYLSKYSVCYVLTIYSEDARLCQVALVNYNDFHNNKLKWYGIVKRIPFLLEQETRIFELRVITRVLSTVNGHQQKAADVMSISRRKLIYRLSTFPEIRLRIRSRRAGSPDQGTLRHKLSLCEYRFVLDALEDCAGDQDLAANTLGISKDELRAILDKNDKRNVIVYKNSELKSFNLMDLIDSYEKKLIKEAIAQCGGDRKAAAESMGIPRRTLYWKINKHGIDSK